MQNEKKKDWVFGVKHSIFFISSLQNKQDGVLNNDTQAEHIIFFSFNIAKVLTESTDIFIVIRLHRTFLFNRQ